MINAWQGAPTPADATAKAIKNHAENVNTALPGNVLVYDSKKQRVQVQAAIKRKVGDDYIEYPPCINVPVCFAGSQDWSVFHEIKTGDNGVMVFSQAAMDQWIHQDGIQEPFDCRMFSHTDACFFPGVRSDPQAFPSFPNSGIGVTSKDNDVQIKLEKSRLFAHKGKTSVELTDAQAKVLRGSTSTTLTDAAVSISIGATSIVSTQEMITLTAGGNTLVISAAGVTHNGVNIGATHVHSQKPDFGGDKQNDTEVPH